MKPSDDLRPPRIFLAFFRWFCHPDYREEIEGDLLEQFQLNAARLGPDKARRLFARDILRLFHPDIMFNFSSVTQRFMRMTKANWLQLLTLNFLFCLFVILPFLPGPPNKIAIALSALGQFTGIFGILLLPIGLAWTIAEFRKRKSTVVAVNNWNSGFYFATAATVVATLIYILMTGVLYSVEGGGVAGVSAAAGLLLLWKTVPAIRNLRQRPLSASNPAPLYLLSVPVVAFVACIFFQKPVATFSRESTIRKGQVLIAALEDFRASEGRYPETLAELQPAYLSRIPRPAIMGFRAFIYEKTADDYNLSFRQHLGETEELVMYNKNNRHPVKGHYASFEAGAAHWRYYWLD